MVKNLVQCKDCGKEVSRSARTCPSCGATKPYEGTGWPVALGLLILLLVLVAVFSGDSEGHEYHDCLQLSCVDGDRDAGSKEAI